MTLLLRTAWSVAVLSYLITRPDATRLDHAVLIADATAS